MLTCVMHAYTAGENPEARDARMTACHTDDTPQLIRASKFSNNSQNSVLNGYVKEV